MHVPPPPNKTNMRGGARLLGGRRDGRLAINDKVTLQLNGYNLTDEDVRRLAQQQRRALLPGTPRSALLTVNFTF